MATTFKSVANFARATVSSGALNNTTSPITFTVDDGSRFSTSNFYVTAWDSALYQRPSDDPNRRVGLCTSRSGNSLTVNWGISSTSIIAIPGTPSIIEGLIDQHLTDIHTAINTAESDIDTLDSTIIANDALALHKATNETVTGIKTFNAGTFIDKGSRVYDIRAYGAVADYKNVNDAAMTTGASNKVVTSATAAFTSADVGKTIVVMGAAAAGGILKTTIAAYTSSTQVTLTVGCSTSVTNAKCCYGTNNSPALQAAVDAADTAGGGRVFIPAGQWGFGTDMSGDQKDNIWIFGVHRGVTTCYIFGSITPIAFGTGDAGLGNITYNCKVSDLTVDMNLQVGAVYGIIMACAQDCEIENVHIKNQANGAKSMLFFGVSTNADESWVGRNLLVSNCIFSDSTAGWEGITCAQAYNCKFVNCTFRDKTSLYLFLNYGSYNVSVVNCDFLNCGNGINGLGNTEIVGCNFFQAGFTVFASNTTFDSCSFRDFGTAAGINTFEGQLTFNTSKNSLIETGWDATPGEIIKHVNNKVKNCTFRGCSSYAISAPLFLDSGTYYSPLKELTIEQCSFEECYWTAIDVAADYITIDNCISFNNNQLNSSTLRYEMALKGNVIKIMNTLTYDSQGSPTATHDFLIDRQSIATGVFANTEVFLENNEFTLSGPRYYDGSFTSTPPSGTTVHGKNNKKINPDYLYAQGNVTGATTFTRVNGKTITATLTGNITVTFTDGIIKGDTLTLILTQDGTGSRTATWPSNFKKASGSLVLSTAPGSIDVIDMEWDGTSWCEISRSMGLA